MHTIVRVVLGVLVSLWVGVGVVQAGDPTIVGSVVDTPGDRALKVAVVGNYAYLANEYDNAGDLQVIDIRNPASPVVVGSVDIPYGAGNVKVARNYAYVLSGTGDLQVIDISNPASPVIVGSVDTSGRANDVAIAGNYAYVAAENNGLQVIDISNPASPVVVGSVDTPGRANDVAIAGNYAYVAAFHHGLQIIDISNPTSPTFVGSVDTSFAAYILTIVGNYAYVGLWTDLDVVDISNPTSPTIVGSADISWSGNRDITVAGNYAYVVAGTDGLRIIDISNPVSPVVVGSVDTPWHYFGVAVAGSYAYVAASFAGLQVIDISNTTSPPSTTTYSWHTGSWSTCTGPCGTNNGTRTRTVYCKSSTGDQVNDSNCSGAKPATSEPCTASMCPVASILDSPVLSVATSGLQVTLNWTSVKGATGYKLYYAPNPYNEDKDKIGLIELGNKTNYSETLWEGASFYVAISAYNADGESEWSNIVQFSLKKTVENEDGYKVFDQGKHVASIFPQTVDGSNYVKDGFIDWRLFNSLTPAYSKINFHQYQCTEASPAEMVWLTLLRSWPPFYQAEFTLFDVDGKGHYIETFSNFIESWGPDLENELGDYELRKAAYFHLFLDLSQFRRYPGFRGGFQTDSEEELRKIILGLGVGHSGLTTDQLLIDLFERIDSGIPLTPQNSALFYAADTYAGLNNAFNEIKQLPGNQLLSTVGSFVQLITAPLNILNDVKTLDRETKKQILYSMFVDVAYNAEHHQFLDDIINSNDKSFDPAMVDAWNEASEAFFKPTANSAIILGMLDTILVDIGANALQFTLSSYGVAGTVLQATGHQVGALGLKAVGTVGLYVFALNEVYQGWGALDELQNRAIQSALTVNLWRTINGVNNGLIKVRERAIATHEVDSFRRAVVLQRLMNFFLIRDTSVQIDTIQNGTGGGVASIIGQYLAGLLPTDDDAVRKLETWQSRAVSDLGETLFVPTVSNAIEGLLDKGQITGESCSQSDEFPYKIGDIGPAGGIVFYVTDSISPRATGGLYGLEVSPVDLGEAEWGCVKVTDTPGGTQTEGAILGASGTAIGTGPDNTSKILAACPTPTAGIAARLADDYELNGYTDWFLPSKDELNQLYQNKDIVGGFAASGYWSSSEHDGGPAIFAWYRNFGSGYQDGFFKSGVHRVRAIRAFPIESIPYIWQVGSWRSCTGECGTNNGTQTREVNCLSSENKIVADSLCSGPKPQESQACTVNLCTTGVYKIGDTGPAGGIVFYVTDGGFHGLEVAPVDQGSAEWGCDGTGIGETSPALGSGANNTQAILAVCPTKGIAARLADNYELNGYTDWFLPSRVELRELHPNIDIAAGLANDYYWSSTEAASSHAWYVHFTNAQRIDLGPGGKFEALRVRAIRAF